MDADRCLRLREIETTIATWLTLHDQLWRQGLAAEVHPETAAITAALNEALVKAEEVRACLDLATTGILALTRRLDGRL